MGKELKEHGSLRKVYVLGAGLQSVFYFQRLRYIRFMKFGRIEMMFSLH